MNTFLGVAANAEDVKAGLGATGNPSILQAGQEERTKDHPSVVVVSTEDAEGETVVRVAPITHGPPIEVAETVEIPQVTKERLGLDDGRSWVVVSETNLFVWPGPDVRPIQPGKFTYGFLPPKLFIQVRDQLVALYRAKTHKSTRRTE